MSDQVAKPGDVKRVTDFLRPILKALENSEKILRDAEALEADMVAREDQRNTLIEQIKTLSGSAEECKATIEELFLDRQTATAALKEAEQALEAQRTKMREIAAEEKAQIATALAEARANADQEKATLRVEIVAAEEAAVARKNAIEAEIEERRQAAEAAIAPTEQRLVELQTAIEELKRKF